MKTIILAPLLYGFSSAVADISNFQRALKSIDTQSVIDRIKERALLFESNGLASASDNEGEDCEAVEMSYYNNTAIMMAYPFVFIPSGDEWKEPSFDLDSFFEDMNFDNECESMGGIVDKVDVNFFCSDDYLFGGDDDPESESGDDGYENDDPESESGEVKGILREYRVCRPPVCSDVQYFQNLEMLFAFTGFFNGCEISIDTGGRGLSFACLQGLEEIYNTTGLEGYSVLTFVDEDLVYFAEEDCTSFSDDEDDLLFVCRMEKYKEDQALIAEACEGGKLGTILPLDVRFDTIDTHVTITRYPQCVPETCTNNEMMLYFDAFSQMVAEESEDFYYHFQKSTINSCDEYNRDRAFMKKVGGKVVDKTCKWLKNRPDALKKDKFCKKTVSFGEYGPARDVCPITCCACEEKGENLFLKKAQKNEAGLLKIVHKDCNWLKSIPEKNRRFHCDKKAASYLGGYPPAADACPETCGACIGQE